MLCATAVLAIAQNWFPHLLNTLQASLRYEFDDLARVRRDEDDVVVRHEIEIGTDNGNIA